MMRRLIIMQGHPDQLGRFRNERLGASQGSTAVIKTRSETPLFSASLAWQGNGKPRHLEGKVAVQ
jgi:hypothetical protein